jgi:hypothetical protein
VERLSLRRKEGQAVRTKNEDKTMEVINAIRKYDLALETVANTADKIKDVSDRLVSPGSPHLDGMPHQPNPHAGEARLVAGIDLMESMRERYRMAELFLLWFEPMWKALSDDERDLLETYKYSDRHCGEMERYASEVNLSIRQAHRSRRKALDHLQTLLFGCL